MTKTSPQTKTPGLRDVFRALKDKKVFLTLLLGFSAGLPFMLTGNTMGMWLRDSGSTLSAIGFLSWVGLAYSFKFLWAPLLDKTSVPILSKLGHRRSWVLLSQLIVGVGLLLMAIVGPGGGLTAFGIFALVVAFASSTQDIALDAWRIESAENDEQLALISSAFLLGYRAALLITDALILIVVAKTGWSQSYFVLAAAMAIGITATLFAAEPPDSRSKQTLNKVIWSLRGMFDAVAGPFIAFFKAHGQAALLMLLAISMYRLADFVMGPMAGPLYLDLGISKETIGTVRATNGLVATIIGVAFAGISAIRLGFLRTLVIGAILGPGSNIAFSVLAWSGGDLWVFNLAMIIDNFSGGFSGAALVAWMSSLTSAGYTASQYALMSSFYAILGKILKGFSGKIVDLLAQYMDLINAYAVFFAGTALIGIPALILCLLVSKTLQRQQPN
ncbi:AmpG permease [hydrothermal vent metagenome]|uniref:AmpG permease n=1 Tax=hydrothermal vent metagenome TaxID=652676 RepID=A0A3B0RMH5_9ZZZZ